MKVELKVIGPNQTEVHIGDKILFFSYDTLVAVKWEGTYYRTDKKYSKTTAKHLNDWCPADAEITDEVDLQGIASY